MSVIVLDSLPDEFVTPKHSKAQGCLITGEQLEVGILALKAEKARRSILIPTNRSSSCSRESFV